MFSNFTQLFGRDFIIGYFLPALLFVTVSALLYLVFVPQAVSFVTLLLGQLQDIWTVSATLFSIWTLGILLMVLNRELIRMLEGYGFLAKTPLHASQLRRFDQLQSEITETANRYKAEVKELGQVSAKLEGCYAKLLLKRWRSFPFDREHILATSFGNVIRAFEVYSQAIYGLDAIPVWTRIIALVPDHFRERLGSTKAQVDFAVNAFYLSLLVVLQYVGYAIVTRSIPLIGVPFAALAAAWLGYRFAVSSALEWGEHVKAVFDLYRHGLLRQMGLEIPETWEDERRCWQEINRSFLYWDQLDVKRRSFRNEEQG